MNAYRKSSCFAAAVICLALMAPSSVGAQAPTTAPSTLAPGVLVGGANFPSSAWIADEVGRVAAINLDNGATNWRGPAEGLPLALVDRTLVVLARPERSGQMNLLLLDPASGSSLGSLLGELPEGVLASPYAQPNRIFTAVADTSTGTLRVFWTYSEWPLRGAHGDDDDTPDAGRREINGVMTVDFSAQTLKLSTTAGAPAVVPADLTGAERIPGINGTQFRSADGKYAQAATPVEDDQMGTAWRWTVHERSSARAVAEVQLPFSHAPFLVRANRLIWQSSPIAKLEASGEYLQQSLRLVCQDLATGRELWSVDLLDQKFRGCCHLDQLAVGVRRFWRVPAPRANDDFDWRMSSPSGNASGTMASTTINTWAMGTYSFYLGCSNGAASDDIALVIQPSARMIPMR